MITYPCYKSFDEFLDVEKLKNLDGYLTERILRHIAAKSESFFLNAYRLDSESPYQPGAREIWLSAPLPNRNLNLTQAYDELDKPDVWIRTPLADEFEQLIEFVDTLPFESTSRILIIYDDAETFVPAHTDHLNSDVCHEFVWFRTNLRKPFYMLNAASGERNYVSSYSAWFDCVNQFHGTDPVKGLSFSMRVDGLFTAEFRQQIPIPEVNVASTPALWACMQNENSESKLAGAGTSGAIS